MRRIVIAPVLETTPAKRQSGIVGIIAIRWISFPFHATRSAPSYRQVTAPAGGAGMYNWGLWALVARKLVGDRLVSRGGRDAAVAMVADRHGYQVQMPQWA